MREKANYLVTTIIAVISLSGCATQGSRPLSASSLPRSVEVVAVLPGIQAAPNLDTSNGFVVDVVMPTGGASPGLTLNQALSGPGIVGGAIASVLISAIIGNEAEKQRIESKELLARHGRIFTAEYPKILLQERLLALSAQPTNISIDRVSFVAGDSITTGVQEKPAKSSALLRLFFAQSLSLDLSKLRLQLQAVAIGSGGELMRQNFYFLPISVEGATKDSAMQTWSGNDGKLYQEQMKLGTDALVDALNLSFFSYKLGGLDTSSDAASLLKKTNCYGGDYDVGIPREAYKSGTILAVRDKHVVVRLSNNDILTFPTCGDSGM